MLGAAFLLHTAARNILVLAITHRNTSQRECLGGCFREGRQGIFEKGFEIGGKERERGVSVWQELWRRKLFHQLE